ncbi:septation protein A [Bartonella ancashensis]|uniref:Inner membrane-spanning protein YciB n=1 Tax=Bartonella ancashensis TaxID=1318743 RepID=A0A0M4LI10_9HYPH|nr:septation protein A [Bartonella ancashensis]ALE03256.1 putative intracellular septation protein [Bartonella ancashensis]
MKNISHKIDSIQKNTSKDKEEKISPFLKFCLEMGPLLIFFLANYKGEWLINNIELFKNFSKPIFPATIIFMISIVIALITSWVIVRTIIIMPLISGVLVLIFGFLTIWLNDDTFIKVKPTIINGLFATILFGSLFFGKPLLHYFFNNTLKLDEQGWKKMTYSWAFFFVFLAFVNEIVWRNFSDNFWATFKVFGVMPMTILFTLTQIPIMMKHSIKDDKSNS